METANLFLSNTLLLLATLLFLAVLPRALRHILLQKEKTALDRAVERFEKEELKATAEGKSNENNTKPEKPVSPKDRSLAYLMEDLPTSPETEEYDGIPPFSVQEKKKAEKIKIVKVGVPISHYEATDPPPGPKKKFKLIKQEISIAPGKDRVPSKKVPSDPLKSKPLAKNQKSSGDKNLHVPPINDYENEESENNWIEAEIPGLTLEPPRAAERSESIPTFKASPKAKHPSEAGKPQKSFPKEKQGMKAKNLAPETKEKKNLKPKKQVKIKTDPPKLEIKISESKPKVVEIKTPVVSHKNIAKKGTGQKKAKAPSAKAGRIQKTEPGGTAVPPQREDIKTSPEKAKPKPFLLDLKFLDQEELETVNPVAHEKLPADMMDVVIARLNALQVDLENQLTSIPGELIPGGNPVNGNMRKDRIQDSFPDLEGAINEPSDNKEVSLEDLDSFLFTAIQRKNRE